MTATSLHEERTPGNPLDMVEELVSANKWAFNRANSDELAVEIGGQWGDYRLHFCWMEEVGCMLFSSALDLRVPPAKRRTVREMLALVNERLWLGHFDLAGDDAVPMFRQTMLLRGAQCASIEQFEDLVDAAVEECDRFYPAFQFVVWGGKDAEQAIEAAMLDTMGEA